MELYNLGGVSWLESQSLYHALALLGREGLIICYPTSPYVCLGLHDDLEQEIDLEFCREQGIPLLRRETGGGVVYLDSNQIFFQLVLRRDNPVLPLRRNRFYQRFLKPAISVYQRFGLPAGLKSPADIVVNGRKCSGNASGDIGQCTAYAGNILLDFDFATMSRVLRVSGTAFREYLRSVMRDHMTTLADWIDELPGHSDLAGALVEGFKEEFGLLSPRLPDTELINLAGQVGERLISQEWLNLPGRRSAERRIKIAEGVYLMERVLERREHLILVTKDGVIDKLNVVGRNEVNEEAPRGVNGFAGGVAELPSSEQLG